MLDGCWTAAGRLGGESLGFFTMFRKRDLSRWMAWMRVMAGLLLATQNVRSSESKSGDEFFERKIRPVLVERCYKCHSGQSEKLKGGLRLDSREGLIRGGDTGPIVVPGEPHRSRLLEAIRYENQELQMPPKGKLPETEIADIDRWIGMGAPWPSAGNGEQAVSGARGQAAFDLRQRRQEHWAWQSLRRPAVSTVKRGGWRRNPVDDFILAELEKRGLEPAAEADRRTIIRRLYFDLWGLAPSPAEVEEFERETSAGAYERLVDRLLAGPAFGERWGRHWLDLVRYSETLGHEFDYSVPNAWRYRDYVIRALNSDVRYDQWVMEHVAGDLLAQPRMHEQFNESVIGTAFYWFGQQTHSPVDVRQHQADVVENQVDVLSKTFLGLTVACARCHDHKFDAISTSDYYSLYGVLTSSRYGQRSIREADWLSTTGNDLRQLKEEIRHAAAAAWDQEARGLGANLLGALRAGDDSDKTDLDRKRLARWREALKRGRGLNPTHPARAVADLLADKRMIEDAVFARWLTEARKGGSNGGDETEVFVEMGKTPLVDWFRDGEAFQVGTIPRGELIVDGDKLRLLSHAAAHSGELARTAEGVLRSPTFEIGKRYMHLLVSGRESRLNVFVDNFALIQDPIYGSLRRVVNEPAFKWMTVDLGMWKGHRAYLEFSDIAAPDLAGGGQRNGYDRNGWISLAKVVFSESATTPVEEFGGLASLLGKEIDGIRRVDDLVLALERRTRETLAAWNEGSRKDEPSREQIAWLEWLVSNDLLEPEEGSQESHRLRKLRRTFSELEGRVPISERVPAMVDGTGLDEFVFVRGNPRTLGERVPRRFLEALGGTGIFKKGSGRLELAEQMIDEENPLVARVMANRVWLHLFGRGIVATPDDFGVLGRRPTHPELLDWLGDYFRREGEWSIKGLIRLLTTSSTYRMSSRTEQAKASEIDPENLWWHRMPVRRMEGEAMRDTMLALAGRLDRTMFGPPVPLYLDEFMEGRGRPAKSGPQDGNGRRSIYIETRRNFLAPMMRVFDTPVPFTTVGRRTVSNVPAQSLILMNDPFVIAQAEQWAIRVLSVKGDRDERIRRLYAEAFGRTPTAAELQRSMRFLADQGRAYGLRADEAVDSVAVWSDYCHALLNVKEFVFVN